MCGTDRQASNVGRPERLLKLSDAYEWREPEGLRRHFFLEFWFDRRRHFMPASENGSTFSDD